jgi:3-methyladenine DNA glycosylase AlkC
VLHRHLPEDFGSAVDVLLATLPAEPTSASGMAPFFYLAHTEFVRQFGVPHFEHAMRAVHALTQVFTGEFAIRPFLEQRQDETLQRLQVWTTDTSEHVRRLVSEGTRPRLPWAPRLRAFQRDPSPVLALLERLRDDPALYVRRSVANNLNDIGKDHPAFLTRIASAWLTDASVERQWIVTHALRSAVKRGDQEALAVLGFGGRARLDVTAAAVSPVRPVMGSKVVISCTLANPTRRMQRVVADLRVHFVKSRGVTGAKVFKLAALELAAGASIDLRKAISLADLTTRQHYPGLHRVELQLNGVAQPLIEFTLVKPRAR